MHFIEPVLHGQKVAQPFCGIDVVHNGDVTHAHAVKFFFQQLPDDQPISAEP